MKKSVIIVLVAVCFVVGIGAFVYIFAKRITSDETIKNRLLGMMKEFGDTEVDSVHIDFLEGITIKNFSFVGTSEDTRGKSLKIPRIVLKHDPQSLIKGQFVVNNAIVIAPELTVEKPTDIWSLLNTIKAHFDEVGIPPYVNVLRQGIEIRDLKIHIKEDPQTSGQEIKLSGIDIVSLPYAGSFKDIIIKGSVDDEFLGNYSFAMKLFPEIPRLDIKAYANNVMMNERFCSKFPYLGKMLWEKYQPEGRVSAFCNARFDNKDKQEKMDYIVSVNLNGLKGMYQYLPVSVQDVNGELELNPAKIYLRRITAYVKCGESTSQAELSGEFDLYGPRKTFALKIANLFMDQELLKKIPDIDVQVCSKIQPTGMMDLTFQYNEGENQKRDYYLSANGKGLEVRLKDFPLPISYVTGDFNLANDIAVFKNASGFIECGDQSIFTEMNGVYDTNKSRKIFHFYSPSVSITESFLKNLPNKMLGEKIWTHLQPAGKIEISGDFQDFLEQKDFNYAMAVELKGCEVLAGTYKIPLWGMEGRLEFCNAGIVGKHISARCCGGQVVGNFIFKTDIDPNQYEGEVIFSRITLEELSRKIGKKENALSGLLYGNIKFHGNGTDPKSFCAEGKINVDEGYLSDVPIILNIFNVLNLSLPKKESFHSAKVRLDVKDGIIHIDEGMVSSDTVEISGHGDIHFNGDVRLEAAAAFNKGFFSQLPIVGRFFDLVVGGVRKQLTMVEVRGTFSNPEIHSVPFKPLTRSIESLFEILPKHEPNTTSDGEKKSEARGL
ncbi:hypothetical protein BIY37_08820 [Candidatus Brocadia sapporoensis]|uniref:AsmA-like C-terminal domain-containing protein n=1 Tax=Candidatus Brocadia sapporoensis TaxID=392547 RepID=A0A1V6LZ33_9BACT|nr:AsmA-like C-terminal domain-containing protein [Candidatus Brocadia sapporoensis]MDG6005231.1 hypothetical protein [Candidatus Brocadia sp.]OQD45357.1 hypothetical protein BIY37_08820 [Candidatus Brocadia sapporoensis]GJQ24187.1 MAG: hypothetical protein HBSAPP01_19770 [Candidatus Brocadia sapporoensis]